MPISPVTTAGSAGRISNAEQTAALNNSFRDADFMKILLSEITNQDPFKPQDAQQIVDSMQKLQQLANSRFEKFRDDQRWARDLVGDSVTVEQGQFGDAELKELKERGLNPDVGFQSVRGVVESFRVIGDSIWMRVEGKDYTLDSVRQLDPPKNDGATLAGMADVLGRQVTWAAEGESASGAGQVSSMRLGDAGEVLLGIGSQQIALSRIRSIATL